MTYPEFLNWKYKISDLNITKIDHAFIMDYDFWLRSVRKCANNTAIKYIQDGLHILQSYPALEVIAEL